MHPTRQRWLDQAAFCRREWKHVDFDRRKRLIQRLLEEQHPIGVVWVEVLRGDHPLSAWLDADTADPPVWDTLPSPRQLFSSHPFSDKTPWSIR